MAHKLWIQYSSLWDNTMLLRMFVAGLITLIGSQLHAAVVVQGQIEPIVDGGGSTIGSNVDHWKVKVNSAGIVTIDVLSWEQDSEDRFDNDGIVDEYIDVNGDGEIAFFDPYIYLFNDDGALDSTDLIASVDDSSATYGDGSIYAFDSFLSINLGAGDYILAIGAFFLNTQDAIDQINLQSGNYPVTTDFVSSDHGDYQITFNGDVTVEGAGAVPEPSTLAMFGLGGLGLAFGAIRRRFRKSA